MSCLLDTEVVFITEQSQEIFSNLLQWAFAEFNTITSLQTLVIRCFRCRSGWLELADRPGKEGDDERKPADHSPDPPETGE